MSIEYKKTTEITRGNSYDYTFTFDDGRIYSDVANFPEEYTDEEVDQSISKLFIDLSTSPFIN